MQAQADLPQDDQPASDCNPNCLCCRGGKAVVWRTPSEWGNPECSLCGGHPPGPSTQRTLLDDRLKDLKACCRAYKAQLELDDPLRTFTLPMGSGHPTGYARPGGWQGHQERF